MLLGSAGWGVGVTGLGLAPNVPVALACLVVAGAADSVAVVARGTVVQVNTPDDLLGRVSAAELTVGSAGPDLGNLRAGLMAAPTSAATSVVAGGVLSLLALAAIAGARSGQVRR